jgi:hypothetical protein
LFAIAEIGYLLNQGKGSAGLPGGKLGGYQRRTLSRVPRQCRWRRCAGRAGQRGVYISPTR